MSEEGSGDAPVCVAVVICNDVIEDKRTNNKTLVGLFNAIATAQLPVAHPRMFVMASITNIRGDVEVGVSLRRPSGTRVLEIQGTLSSDDPLSVQDLVVELVGTPFEEEGVYFLDVSAGGRYLGGRRFTILLQSSPV